MKSSQHHKTRLHELATVLRSKNAGPFLTTFDLFFDDKKLYQRVKNSGVLSRALISKLYKLNEQEVEGIFFVDSVKGIKITIAKPANMTSGDAQCRDLFGAQQHSLLMDIEIPQTPENTD